MRNAIIFLGVVLGGPRIVPAQACLGHTPFAAGSVKFGAGAEFGNGSTAFWGGGWLGRPAGLFGGASAGLSSGDGASGTLLSAEVGKQLAQPITGKLVLCPMARVGLQFGPGKYSERNFIFAAMVAYPLTIPGSTTTFNLVGGYQGAYQVYGETESLHEWYGLLDAGIGVTFNRRFSLIPQVRIPVGYGGQDPSFIIRGSVNLGGSR